MSASSLRGFSAAASPLDDSKRAIEIPNCRGNGTHYSGNVATSPHVLSRRMKSFQSLAHLFIALLSLTSVSLVAAQDEAPGLPAELAALDAQFQLLQKERVLLPFDLDLARLNTSYFGGLDKAMAAEKAKGDLDATLALENEKQAFTKLPEVPEKDDSSTPEIL